jgi:hypothetical protein
MREDVGQPSRRRLTEGRCGSTKSTTFEWRDKKTQQNNVLDITIRYRISKDNQNGQVTQDEENKKTQQHNVLDITIHRQTLIP